MALHILHTLSGLFIIIFFAGKAILHYHLDYKHHGGSRFLHSLAMPMQYFRPHKTIVDKGFLKLQRLCNLLLTFDIYCTYFKHCRGCGYILYK